MLFRISQYTLIVSGLAGMIACKEDLANSEDSQPSQPLFTSLQPAQVNIDFANTLSEGLNTNILIYEYFYNGSGVATGDLNGDGLDDIYLVSNMGSNKFYLNQGNLRFKDVGRTSRNLGNDGPWKTGVSIVDINGDNKLDLYLCYSGAMPEPKRINQLFINTGNNEEGIPIFKESANEYGLASSAYSNQSYFFDYDKDGDLDMILLNHNPKSLPILNEVSTAEFLKKDDPLMGTRLFCQTRKGHFEDVTRKSGINGSALSYGLGVAVGDFNGDGWSDFYVSNDYNVPDYLYLNNQDGTFTDHLKQSIGHNSQFSMGNDASDVNNDGWTDILTLDMLPEDNRRQKLLLAPDNYGKFELNLRSGFHYQYMRNMLQLNNGNGTFSEVGQLAGISNTDWSWSALLADYNNDGWKDLFITNGYFRDYTNLDFIKYMNEVVEVKGRLKREDVVEIIKHMPSSNVVNYIFSNHGGVQFVDQTKNWGMSAPSNSTGAAYSDLDNDGDLDLVANNINQQVFICRNDQEKFLNNHFLQCKLVGQGMNTQGIGARVSVDCQGKIQVKEQMLSRGYLSSVSPILHFGLGDNVIIDSLIITWNSNRRQIIANVKVDQLLTLEEKNATLATETKRDVNPIFSPVKPLVQHTASKVSINDFNRQPQLPFQFSYSGRCLIKADVNKDGREDIFIGGCQDEAAVIFVQNADSNFQKKIIPDFEQDKKFVDADAAFLDIDNDGDLDLYVASGGYHTLEPDDQLLQDRLYQNDGMGNFAKDINALPKMSGSKACVRINDMNQDGYMDIYVGSRVVPGRYPETPTSYFLINDGHGRFTDKIVDVNPQLQQLGMITDAKWVDLNNDNVNDLVVVGEWLPVSVWISKGRKLINSTDKYFDKEYVGFWNSIQVADFNKDNKPDLMIGNLGLNEQFKASDEEPVELFFNDFDKNGSIDPIFCFYIQSKRYPYLTRDELLEQQGRFRSKYNTYKSYADLTLDEILTPEEIGTANHVKANHLSSTLFLSSNDDKFTIGQLPIEVQYAPIYCAAILDYNEDGNLDLLLGGNLEHTKLKVGKFDANYGLLLNGDGKGNFKCVNQIQSGFRIKGDVRSIVELNDQYLISTIQNPLIAYRKTSSLK